MVIITKIDDVAEKCNKILEHILVYFDSDRCIKVYYSVIHKEVY
jgi:chaperone required for assembly of F1-ATPase